jgi:hypothetical protein
MVSMSAEHHHRLLTCLLTCLLSCQVVSANIAPRMNDATARRLLDPALMCLAIYADAGVSGWTGPAFQMGGFDFRAGAGGLRAGAYQRDDLHASDAGRMILAYRGTEPGAIDDWSTDLANAFGLAPDAYLEAVKWAQAARSKARQAGLRDIMLTGHSLGGGLACFAALELGVCACGFGSTALGAGLQEILRNDVPENLARADTLVTHAFMANDPVPPLTALTGTHPGAVPRPLLTPRADYTGLRSPVEKAAFWAVTGLVTDRWLSATARTLKEYVSEAHGIDYYLAGLSALITPVVGLDPCGQWESRGSFFDLTTSQTRFLLSRNGQLRLLNQFTVMDKLKTNITDAGTWNYSEPVLTMSIKGLGTLTYTLTAGEGAQVLHWQRTRLEPDIAAIQAATTQQEREQAKLVAAVVSVPFKLMQGKTVMWQRLPAVDLLPESN